MLDGCMCLGDSEGMFHTTEVEAMTPQLKKEPDQDRGKVNTVAPEAAASHLIRRSALCKMLGISVSASYLKANPRSAYFCPRFPRPVRIGAKAVAWKLGEVLAYIDSLERA